MADYGNIHKKYAKISQSGEVSQMPRHFWLYTACKSA